MNLFANFPACMTHDEWKPEGGEFGSSEAHLLRALEQKAGRIPNQREIGIVGKAICDGCIAGCKGDDGDICARTMIAKLETAYTIPKACEFYVADRTRLEL